MRKFISLSILLIFMLWTAINVMAASIMGSKHDLSSGGGGAVTSGTDRVCIHCHTPHNAESAVVPLWNRSEGPNTLFTPYSSSTLSGPNTKTNPYTPAPISMACLVCHDGSVADTGNPGGPVQGPSITYVGSIAGLDADLGTDLSDDHPISVSLAVANTAKPTGYRVNPTGTAVRLFSGNVECASCHFVHDPAIVPFLAGSNAGSAICTACHTK